MVEKFIIDRRFQHDFLAAVVRGQLKQFMAVPEHDAFFEKIYNWLEMLEKMRTNKLSINFRRVCTDLVDRIDISTSPLTEWKTFYAQNESLLDEVIKKCRKKKIVRFEIEGANCELYSELKAARKSYRKRRKMSDAVLDYSTLEIDENQLNWLSEKLKKLYFFKSESKRCLEICNDFRGSLESSTVEQFYASNERVLDEIVRTARKEKVVAFRIVGHKGKKFKTFQSARKSYPANFHRGQQISTVDRPKERSLNDSRILAMDVFNHQATSTNAQHREKLDLEEHRRKMRAIELKVESPKLERELPRIERTPSNTSALSIDWEARRSEQARQHQNRMDSLNDYYDAKIRETREETARIDEETRLELLEMRTEAALRDRFFLECVRLKLRWQEQEDEWNRFLATARKPVIRLKMEFGRCFGRFGYRDEVKVERLRNVCRVAYQRLADDFDRIKELAEEYDDKLFLKVIMCRISGVATAVCALEEALTEFKNDIQLIERCEVAVKPQEIPSTAELRNICKSARWEDYEHVAPPERPKQCSTLVF